MSVCSVFGDVEKCQSKQNKQTNRVNFSFSSRALLKTDLDYFFHFLKCASKADFHPLCWLCFCSRGLNSVIFFERVRPKNAKQLKKELNKRVQFSAVTKYELLPKYRVVQNVYFWVKVRPKWFYFWIKSGLIPPTNKHLEFLKHPVSLLSSWTNSQTTCSKSCKLFLKNVLQNLLILGGQKTFGKTIIQIRFVACEFMADPNKPCLVLPFAVS